MAEKKVRKQPLEIDKANLTRLRIRIGIVGEARAQAAFRSKSNATVFETITADCEKAETAVTTILEFLAAGNSPPEQSDDSDE